MLLLKQPPTNDTQDQKDVARYAVDPLGRALGLVPFVVNAVKAEAVRARVCSVTRLGGSKYRVITPDEASFATISTRIVDIEAGTCDCLTPDNFDHACMHGLAAHQLEGRSWQEVLQSPDFPLNDCYKLNTELFKTVSVTPVTAPGIEDLAAQKSIPEYAAQLADRRAEAGLVNIIAPPLREAEAHGGSKRKRKTKSTGASTKGRTGSRSYATTASEKRKARSKSRKCTLAGREGEDTYKHRSGTCPYDVADEALILVSSSDDGGHGGAGPADDGDDENAPLSSLASA
jgi:hypothetical protein